MPGFCLIHFENHLVGVCQVVLSLAKDSGINVFLQQAASNRVPKDTI